MQPFRLEPACKDYLWGGVRLKAWGKGPALDRVSESWELAAHPDGDSTALDGPCVGMTLSRIAGEHPEIISPHREAGASFPLIVKLIDARLPLSIQVHPDGVYAARAEGGRGKTEMWYVLDHEPGAFIYLGFQRETGRQELERAIAEGSLPSLLQRIEVHRGGRYFIPAGTVHSIGGGILLAEVQESSNLTYRVFDYNRAGPDGKPRQLHVTKALDVIRRTKADPVPPGAAPPKAVVGGSLEVLAHCPQFRAGLLRLDDRWEAAPQGGFLSLLCLKGNAGLSGSGLTLEAGTSLFVPADAGTFELTAGRGGAEFLLTAPGE
ncbi:MAG: class I mannose-6-phosphate isomerase [Fretibacterium sp.]|nr:class I mannose-6-phosphate isomerase [Fretibacterium sp.]